MNRLKSFGVLCALLASTVSYAQRAENLNLGTPAQAPYNCYGLLTEGCPNAEKLGLKVGLQFYTLNKYTFFEGIDIAKALGLKYIEATIGARICSDSKQGIHAGLSQEWKDKIKQKLSQSGVKCQSIYYWMDGKGNGFEDVVKFCKEMGWTIVADPKRAVNGGQPIDFYEKILDKYDVKMVLTNHPKAAAYWNPDFTVEDTQGRGKNIGASVDFGHYMRGGFQPYDIVKRYLSIGKMDHFHLRDVSAVDPHGLDVPCGAGAGRVKDVLQALVDAEAHPLMMLEYEHDFDNPMPYLIQSVNFINKTCGEILQKKALQAQKGDAIVLGAASAKVSSNMNIQGTGDKASIHGWNNASQCIEWATQLPAGNYQVLLTYTQPYQGSAITIDADGEELASLITPTFTWYDYQTHDLGVLKIKNGGDVVLKFKGIQQGIKKNKEGKLVANEAFPDIMNVQLIPTSLEHTSQPINIISQFKGKRIFNGKNFEGWQGNNGEESLKHFRVEKKCIVGGVMNKDLEHNQFLRTFIPYKDFELHLRYKVKANDDQYNGGIQFRSVPCTVKGKEYEMVGYQADIISWKQGALYDEQRRWEFLGASLGKVENYDASQWNDYVIRCEGNRVRIWLNGVKTTDYIDPFVNTPYGKLGLMNESGYIALQIHEGKACEMWYKDIEIENLTK